MRAVKEDLGTVEVVCLLARLSQRSGVLQGFDLFGGEVEDVSEDVVVVLAEGGGGHSGAAGGFGEAHGDAGLLKDAPIGVIQGVDVVAITQMGIPEESLAVEDGGGGGRRSAGAGA